MNLTKDMDYNISLSPSADKYLKKLSKKNKKDLKFLKAVIYNIPNDPYEAMEGKYKGFNRVRKGKYRIIFEIKGNEIEISRIGKRSNIYK